MLIGFQLRSWPYDMLQIMILKKNNIEINNFDSKNALFEKYVYTFYKKIMIFKFKKISVLRACLGSLNSHLITAFCVLMHMKIYYNSKAICCNVDGGDQ